MKRLLLLAICVGGMLAGGSSLERQAGFSRASGTASRNLEGVGASSVFLRMLGLDELAQGLLWLQFEKDSMSVVKNYHRLLPLLDSITYLAPEDVDAWSLKTHMRLSAAQKRGDSAAAEKAIEALQRTVLSRPESFELARELAHQLFFTFRSPQRALPFIERAVAIPGHDMSCCQLQIGILEALERFDEARRIAELGLSRPGLSESEQSFFLRHSRQNPE